MAVTRKVPVRQYGAQVAPASLICGAHEFEMNEESHDAFERSTPNFR